MSIFARILAPADPSQQSGRTAKGTTPPATPAVETATYAELAAAMDRIAELRAQATRDIEISAIARRDAILATDDAAVTAAEGKSDAAHRLIEALDLAEPAIRDRMREIAAERRRAEFQRLAADAIPTGRALVAALEAAAQALAAVHDLRTKLGAVGTATQMENTLPFPPMADFAGFAARYNEAIDRAAGLSTPQEIARRATTFAVRILRHYAPAGGVDGLIPGELRGYSAEDAWRLVAAGIATWADPDRIPAMPAINPLPLAAMAKLAPPPPDDAGAMAVKIVQLGFAAPGIADADLAPGAVLRLPAIYAIAAVNAKFAEFASRSAGAMEGRDDA